MILVDGHDLFLLGKVLQTLRNLRHDDTNINVWIDTFLIENRIKDFLFESDYSSAIRIAVDSAEHLIEKLDEVKKMH